MREIQKKGLLLSPFYTFLERSSHPLIGWVAHSCVSRSHRYPVSWWIEPKKGMIPQVSDSNRFLRLILQNGRRRRSGHGKREAFENPKTTCSRSSSSDCLPMPLSCMQLRGSPHSCTSRSLDNFNQRDSFNEIGVK